MTQEATMERTCKREGASDTPERVCSGRVYSPDVDIVEMENELLLVADMPGVSAGDLDISYEHGQLTLHACVCSRQDEEKSRFMRREYGVGDYYRSFQIGEGIDARKIEAELKEGVLTLHLPKAEAVKPRRIAVKS